MEDDLKRLAILNHIEIRKTTTTGIRGIWKELFTYIQNH